MKKTRNMLPGRIAKRCVDFLVRNFYIARAHRDNVYESIRRIIKEELEKENDQQKEASG